MICRPVWWSNWAPCARNIAIGHLSSRLFRKKAVCSAPCGLVCPRSAVRPLGVTRVCCLGPCSAFACFPITGRELRKGRLERNPACFAMPLSLQQRGPNYKLAYLQAGDMRKAPRTGPLPASFARLFGTQPLVSRLEGLLSLSLSISVLSGYPPTSPKSVLTKSHRQKMLPINLKSANFATVIVFWGAGTKDCSRNQLRD